MRHITLPDGRDYGRFMLEEGHADLFYAEDHSREDTYPEALKTAHGHDRGIWGNCSRT